MNKNTFPFLNNSLKFNSKKHQYTLDNNVYMSVTQWLSTFKEPFDSYKISQQVSQNPNSEYYQMDPAKIRKLWQSTGSRGTKKHNSIEKWIVGNADKCIEMEYLKQIGITPENSWSEIPLVSTKLMLAGTADLITLRNDVYYIYDIKTCKKVNQDKIDDFTKQILTYCTMLYHMTNGTIKIKPGGVISIKPTNDLSKGLSNEFNQPEFISINFDIKDTIKLMIKNRKKEVKCQQEI